MAFRLSFELQPLLRPAHLIPISDVLANRRIIPNGKGIYGWWFDAPLPEVALARTIEVAGSWLLYVGIAPKATSKAGKESSSTLYKRIGRDHLGSRMASSTLRRTLAYLLEGELGLTRYRDERGKLYMSRDDETTLTDWMAQHASLSVLECDRGWDIEVQLVANGDASLPLNIDGSTDAFAAVLSKGRNALTSGGAKASRAPVAPRNSGPDAL